MTPTRRYIGLATGLVLSMTALAVQPGFAAEEKFDGVTIRVATWGGSWRDRIHELIGTAFEKKGGKVEYVIGNALQNFNKLLAAKGQTPPFDIMEFQSDLWRPLMESKSLLPLKGTSLEKASADGFTVPTWTLEEGIVYNEDKFKEMGIPKPKKYSDLFNPKLAGKISWPDIGYGPYALIGLSTEYGGDELNVKPGLDKIKAMNIPAFYKSSVELSTQFKSGDVWAAPWHAGWAVRVKRTNVPLAMAFPEVKGKHGVAASGMVGIVAGTPVQKAAEYWARRYREAEVQIALGSANGVGPVNPDAMAELRKDPLLVNLMLLTPESIGGMYQVNWKDIDLADIVDKWGRATAK